MKALPLSNLLLVIIHLSDVHIVSLYVDRDHILSVELNHRERWIPILVGRQGTSQKAETDIVLRVHGRADSYFLHVRVTIEIDSHDMLETLH